MALGTASSSYPDAFFSRDSTSVLRPGCAGPAAAGQSSGRKWTLPFRRVQAEPWRLIRSVGATIVRFKNRSLLMVEPIIAQMF